MSPSTDLPDVRSTTDLGYEHGITTTSKENGAALPTINVVVLRESRDLLEVGTWIGLDKKGKLMKMHRKGWLLQNMTSYSWLSVCQIIFIFKHSLICYCVGTAILLMQVD